MTESSRGKQQRAAGAGGTPADTGRLPHLEGGVAFKGWISPLSRCLSAVVYSVVFPVGGESARRPSFIFSLGTVNIRKERVQYLVRRGKEGSLLLLCSQIIGKGSH